MNGVRRIEAPGIRSMGVNIDDKGKFYLAYDLKWFSEKTVQEQLFILQHEACHLVLQHIPRVTRMYRELSCGKTLENPFNHRIINVAMDCAVNGGLLHKVMKETLDPGHPYVDPKRDFELPITLTFEEYLGELIAKAEVIQLPPMFSDGSGDDGSVPQDTDSDEDKEDDDSGENNAGGGESQEGEEEEGGGEGQEDEEEESQDSDSQDDENSGSGDEDEEEDKEEDQEETTISFQDEPDESNLREEYPKHLCDFTKQLSTKTEAELERMETEMQKAVKDTVKKAYDQTMRRRGTIPMEVKRIVEDLLREHQVPWEHLFRNMMRSTITTKMVESALIPAYNLLAVMGQGILPYPGLQNDLSFNLSIHIDTSGSISDNDFVTFMTEVAGIIKTVQGVRIHMLMFDTVIQFENVYSDIEVDGIRNELKTYNTNSIYRHGRGGTDFNPSFKRMAGVDVESDRTPNCGGNYAEHRMSKPDMMLFLTDGGAPVASENGGPIPTYDPGCPIIWVICGGEQACVHPSMGQRVVILN
jgi:predicted metal-dependent peptidase